MRTLDGCDPVALSSSSLAHLSACTDCSAGKTRDRSGPKRRTGGLQAVATSSDAPSLSAASIHHSFRNQHAASNPHHSFLYCTRKPGIKRLSPLLKRSADGLTSRTRTAAAACAPGSAATTRRPPARFPTPRSRSPAPVAPPPEGMAHCLAAAAPLQTKTSSGSPRKPPARPVAPHHPRTARRVASPQ